MTPFEELEQAWYRISFALYERFAVPVLRWLTKLVIAIQTEYEDND